MPKFDRNELLLQANEMSMDVVTPRKPDTASIYKKKFGREVFVVLHKFSLLDVLDSIFEMD